MFWSRSLDGRLATPADAHVLASLMAAGIERLIYENNRAPSANRRTVRDYIKLYKNNTSAVVCIRIAKRGASDERSEHSNTTERYTFLHVLGALSISFVC